MSTGTNTKLLSELHELVGFEHGETDATIKSWGTFCEKVANDPRSSGLESSKIKEVVGQIADESKDGIKNISDAVEVAFQRIKSGKSVLETIMGDIDRSTLLSPTETAEAATVYASKKPTPTYSTSGSSGYHNVTTKPKTAIETFTAQWEGMATEHKVSTGISAILAAMMIVSSAAQMRQSFNKDEQGNTHFNSKSFAWAAAQALLGIGVGYLTHSQFKVATAR